MPLDGVQHSNLNLSLNYLSHCLNQSEHEESRSFTLRSMLTMTSFPHHALLSFVTRLRYFMKQLSQVFIAVLVLLMLHQKLAHDGSSVSLLIVRWFTKLFGYLAMLVLMFQLGFLG